MRTRLILPAFLLTSLGLASLPATAQVSVDPRALEPLKKTEPPAPPHTRPAHPAPAKKPEPKPAPKPAGATTVRPNVTAPPQPTVPLAPPATVNIPPPLVVPTRPAQPSAPAAITADAPGEATPIAGGLRVTFGGGRADLNPASEAAIRALVRGGSGQPAPSETNSYTITTYAAGTPEDPSTARRMSLSRALAVRSVLISQGVTSVRIYVKALGPTSLGFADGPPDRADVSLATNPVPPPATTAAKPK